MFNKYSLRLITHRQQSLGIDAETDEFTADHIANRTQINVDDGSSDCWCSSNSSSIHGSSSIHQKDNDVW